MTGPSPKVPIEPPFLARREALRTWMLAQELQGYVLTSLVNIRYITGFTGSNGHFFLGEKNELDVLATDGRYTEQAALEAPELTCVLGTEESWLRPRVTANSRIAVESNHLSWERALALQALLDEVELVAAPRQVEQLRERKDADELALMQQACTIGDHAFGELLHWLQPGVSELAVAAQLEQLMRAAGSQGPAFDTIVASGPHSARPHHRPGTRVLQTGDLVKIDFGAVVGGYHSDMTRTVALGEPGAQLREVHALVMAAQAVGVAAAVAGKSAASVDDACRSLITEAGYGEQFVHPTGHGVGLEIHEQPILHAQATATLRPGMAVTVEPGVYLPGIGGVRIEDVVVVAAEGPPEILTSSPRELIVL